MCAPMMIAPMISAVTGLAGAAVSASGASQAAEADARQAEYNAQISKINARTERQKGLAQTEQIGQKADKLEGQSIAAAGKAGVDPMFGSAALVIFGEGAEARAHDINTTFANAEAAAIGHENKARDLEAQAAAKRQAGKIAAQGSFLSGIGGAVGGLGKAFGSASGSSLFINTAAGD